MDPTAAWATVTDYRADIEDRADAAAALLSWLDNGGALPNAVQYDIDAGHWSPSQDIIEWQAVHVLAEAWRGR